MGLGRRRRGPRSAIEDRCGEDLLDEDAQEVVDVVAPVVARRGRGPRRHPRWTRGPRSTENGVVWVLTPKTGNDGHVEPSDIAEAAPTAGLSQTSNVSVSDGWVGTRLVAPKRGAAPAVTGAPRGRIARVRPDAHGPHRRRRTP